MQGIIAARLDALSGEEKLLIQDAAVIGKVFWSGALAALGGVTAWTIEERLHALERKEFVRRERHGSIASDTEYAFRHLLVRDVAYAQIPRPGRAEKHRLAAEWIGSLAGGRSEDRSEMLAHHYGAALEFARASGEDVSALVQCARVAYMDAGERALALSAISTAVQFFGRTLDLMWEEDDDWPRLVLRHAQAELLLHQGGEHVLIDRALQRFLDAGEIESAAEAELQLAERAWFAGRSDELFERLARARELVANRPASATKTHVYSQYSRFLMLANRNDEAVEAGQESLALARELDLTELQAHALNNIGTARAIAGDREGLAELEEAFDIAMAINSSEAIRSLGNQASLVGSFGDLPRCYALNEQANELAARFGIVGFGLWVSAELALLDYWAGRWDVALEHVDAFLAGAGETHYMEIAARAVLGEVLTARGDPDRGMAESERALALARTAKDPQALYPNLAASAWMLARAGRLAEASDRVEELLALVADREFHANQWALYATFALEDLGRPSDAAPMLAGLRAPTRWRDAATAYAAGDRIGAADILREMGNATDEAYARLRAAELDGATEQIGPALAFYRDQRASAFVHRAEALLLASA